MAQTTASVDAALARRNGDDLATTCFELANAEHVSFAASSGRTLLIRQDAAIPHTGGCIWETSYALALWARAHLEPIARRASKRGAPLRVLELGAGCGFLGLALAHMGFEVVCSEQPGVLANLVHNVLANEPRALGLPGACIAEVLRWGDSEDIAALTGAPFNYVVGTDVVYIPELVQPLLQTLWQCATGETAVLLCLQQRCVASHRLLLEQAGFYFARVEHEPLADSVELVRDFATELDCELLRLTQRREVIDPGAAPSAAGQATGAAGAARQPPSEKKEKKRQRHEEEGGPHTLQRVGSSGVGAQQGGAAAARDSRAPWRPDADADASHSERQQRRR
ncbi:putative methyltransferase-domain-containing protein [Pavlovales sp. CCMP2436]|nr:putative methyltransferase-domain-containing protein [Pavlovales sp. CCMP2436]